MVRCRALLLLLALCALSWQHSQAQNKTLPVPKPANTFNSGKLDNSHKLNLTTLDDPIDQLDSSPPIYLSAVGRVARLGELYDARSDQFLRLELFNDTVPDGAVKKTDNSHTNLRYTLKNSLEEKFNQMDISANLKIAIMSGMLNLEGSGRFFKDSKRSAKSAKATMIYSITTLYEDINFVREDLRRLVDTDALTKISATHVVVGIEWGGNVFITLEDTNEDNQDTQVIEGKLDVELKRLQVEIKGSAKVNVTDEQKSFLKTLNYELFGDILPDTVPQNIVDALQFMQEVPTLVKNANSGKGKAMKYRLMPIEVVRKRFNLDTGLDNLVKEISEATVRKCTRLFDDMNGIEQELNDRLQDIQRHEEYLPSDKAHNFYEVYNAYDLLQSDVRKDLAQSVLDVRSGKKEVNELETILANYTARIDAGNSNRTSSYNEIRSALRFASYLTKQNVTMLKKTNDFRQFLRENFDRDIYNLFYTSAESDQNEAAINTFQTILRKRAEYGNSSIFSAISYDLLDETKQPTIDASNTSKVSLYRNARLLVDKFVPGAKRPVDNEQEQWSLHQIQQVLNASRFAVKPLEEKATDIVPIGYVYVQYPWQSEPSKIWPKLKWQSDSLKYGGAFFRALGGGEPWEKLQQQNSFRLINALYTLHDHGVYNPYSADVTPGKWSDPVCTGWKHVWESPDDWASSMRFLVQDAEVRPNNYGIQIWRRIA